MIGSNGELRVHPSFFSSSVRWQRTCTNGDIAVEEKAVRPRYAFAIICFVGLRAFDGSRFFWSERTLIKSQHI